MKKHPIQGLRKFFWFLCIDIILASKSKTTYLSQIMKELNIPSTLISGILNSIYSRDFDASRLVNKVYELSKVTYEWLKKGGKV